MNALSVAVALVISGFIGTSLLWIKTAAISSELLTSFKELMPREAFAVAPELFTNERNPRKVFFFFTSKAARVMTLKPSLLSLRYRFIKLVILSITLPLSIVVGAACFILVYNSMH